MKKKYPPAFKPFIKRITHGQKNLLELLGAIADCGDIVRLPLVNRSYLINDPEAIQHILLHNFENYTKEGTGFSRVEEIVGKGLLTNSGEAWSHRRQELQPHFHAKNLASYVPLINHYTQFMVDKWFTKSSKLINFTDEMLALVMNISAKGLLGVDVQSESEKFVKLIHIMNAFSVKSLLFLRWLPTFHNLRYQIAKRTLNQFLLKALHQPSDLKEDELTPLLSDLFSKDETGEFNLSEEEYLGEVKNFFIAGHETTGNALSWIFYCLTKNTYAMLQLKNEIEKVLGTREPNLEDLDHLPYTELVIQETLRLYPPIWIIHRKALAEDMIKEFVVPAKTLITISPYLIHRHPKYWQNPNSFYPERFLPEASKNRPKGTYIPFGSGPRVCIGKQFAMMIMKLVIARVMQNFEISLPKKNIIVKPLPLITLKPYKGIWLRVSNKGVLSH